MKKKHNVASLGKMLQWGVLPIVVLMLLGVKPTQAQDDQNNAAGTIWLDLVTTDLQKAKDFYGPLFGWKFTEIDHNNIKNSLIISGSNTIGSIYQLPKATGAAWIPAGVATASELATKTSNLEQKGSKIAIPSMVMPWRGTQVVLEGPQGEEFSLIADNPYRAKNTGAKMKGAWMGAELWAADARKARDFYEYAFGAKLEQQMMNGKPYWFFVRDGKKIAGMIDNPITNQGTQWVPYVYVEDVSATATQSKTLGGTVIAGPSDALAGGKIAILQDPSGALFCIHNLN